LLEVGRPARYSAAVRKQTPAPAPARAAALRFAAKPSPRFLEATEMIGADFLKGTLAPLVLRLALAMIFLYHGVEKIAPANQWGVTWANNQWRQQEEKSKDDAKTKLDKLKAYQKGEGGTGYDPETIDQMKTKLEEKYNQDKDNVPDYLAPASVQAAVAWAEVVCGAALLLGVLTRLAALAMIAVQLGAIFAVTGSKGFSTGVVSGYEFNVVLIAVCLAIAVAGPGALAVDRWLWRRRK
jgi:uncharacterized membrane protein YphA (DoxX/SURF4 family)